MKDVKQDIKKSLLLPAVDKGKANRIGRFISNSYILPIWIFFMDVFFFVLINYVINLFFEFVLTGFGNQQEILPFQISYFFPNIELIRESKVMKVIYLLISVLIVIMDISFVYQMKTGLSEDYFNLKQKGDARFLTLDEIKEQYKAIPDCKKKFPGRGGTIISRYGDVLYIDDNICNNLIIGMTRSGKGEFYVFPSIDVYSRAEQQTSMIIVDPKTELYRASYKTLKDRGYDIYFLNLDDPTSSMGYNPLQLITQYFKEGMYDEAELMSDSFAFSVFNSSKEGSVGNEKFFDETSSSVFSALILAHVKDCLDEDERNNKKRKIEYEKKVERYRKLLAQGEDRDELWRQYKQIEKSCRKREIDILVSKDCQYIPEEIEFEYDSKYEKCINIYSILNSLVELSQIKIINSEDSMLDIFFRIRPALDPGKMRYATALVAGDRTKGSILSNLTNGLKVFQSSAIAKMTAESSLDFKQVGFGEKPVAVFLGIPDYDKSKWFLATVFIRQMYYFLAKYCSRTTGRCTRPVKFICDEFGNSPAIDDMENMITVCAGRNISFDMYIQTDTQLADVYGEKTAETIRGNCANEIFIYTNSTTTTENISKKIGNESVITMQRTGHKLAMHKEFTESVDEKPLLSPNQLSHLLEGECVILRSMKRRDNQGKDVIPYPIFNSKETGTRLKYRYTYLASEFPDPDKVNLKEINTESRNHIEPRNRIFDYNIALMKYQKGKNELIYDLLSESCKKKIQKILHGMEIPGDLKISDMETYLKDMDLEKQDMSAILLLIETESRGIG